MKRATRMVKRIDRCNAQHLRWGVPVPDGKRIYMPDYMPWERVCISGFASLEVSDSIENGVRTFTTELTATLEDIPEYSAVPLAYRVTFQDGSTAVIGLADRPYPTTTIADKHEKKASSSSVCTLTVNWTGKYMPLIIMD